MRYVTLIQLQPGVRLLSGPIPVPRSPSLTESQEGLRDPTPAAPATLLPAMGTSIPFYEISFKRYQPGLGSTFLPGAQFLLVLKKTPGETRTRGVCQPPTKSGNLAQPSTAKSAPEEPEGGLAFSHHGLQRRGSYRSAG